MTTRRTAPLAAVCLLALAASGCEVSSGRFGSAGQGFTASGRVNLTANLRDGANTFLGIRWVRNATGVPVRLLSGTTLVASTMTAAGAYHLTAQFPGDYDVRTEVGDAVFDTISVLLTDDVALTDTLTLVSASPFVVYPNPFGASTTVRFVSTSNSRVVVEVWTLGGASIRTLLDATLPVGLHEVTWSGTNRLGRQVEDGLYWIVMTQDGASHAELVIRETGGP